MRYGHVLDAKTQDGVRLVAVVDGQVTDLSGVVPSVSTLDDLVAAGPVAWSAAENAAQADGSFGADLNDVMVMSPLLRPSKIVCVGLNYHDHAAEQGVELPERPLVFAKFPSTLTGQDARVTWSAELTRQVDWEAELAVVVGRRLREVGPVEAMDGVFGYTAANDLSARDLQFADGQWVRGKSLDGFLPLGPVVVTADEFGDPSSHAVRTRLNGELVQDSDTAQLIFDVGEILSFLSHSFTLEAGDVVLTGTPAGVGAFRRPPVWLKPGDEVEVEIEGVGRLRTLITEYTKTNGGAAASSLRAQEAPRWRR